MKTALKIIKSKCSKKGGAKTRTFGFVRMKMALNMEPLNRKMRRVSMDEKVRMSKTLVECFTIPSEYNGMKVDMLLVPLFNGGSGWVGPGYWQPKIPGISKPPDQGHNTRVYTRKELLEAGAKSRYENLWMR